MDLGKPTTLYLRTILQPRNSVQDCYSTFVWNFNGKKEEQIGKKEDSTQKSSFVNWRPANCQTYRTNETCCAQAKKKEVVCGTDKV